MTKINCRCDGPCKATIQIGEVSKGLVEPKIPIRTHDSWDGVPTVWLNRDGIDDLIGRLLDAKGLLQSESGGKS